MHIKKISSIVEMKDLITIKDKSILKAIGKQAFYYY